MGTSVLGASLRQRRSLPASYRYPRSAPRPPRCRWQPLGSRTLQAPSSKSGYTAGFLSYRTPYSQNATASDFRDILNYDIILLYYTILYYTILYYTILYYTILYYTILYYTILYYTILYYTILYYTILYYTILYYTILYYTILYYTILYYTILYYTILYYTILYYTILYYIILYYTALFLFYTIPYHTILVTTTDFNSWCIRLLFPACCSSLSLAHAAQVLRPGSLKQCEALNSLGVACSLSFLETFQVFGTSQKTVLPT